MAKSFNRILEISNKYNTSLPRLGGSTFRSGIGTRDDELADIQRSIGNYQSRISATGTDVPQPNKALSSLMTVLNVIDAPRNAI